MLLLLLLYAAIVITIATPFVVHQRHLRSIHLAPRRSFRVRATPTSRKLPRRRRAVVIIDDPPALADAPPQHVRRRLGLRFLLPVRVFVLLSGGDDSRIVAHHPEPSRQRLRRLIPHHRVIHVFLQVWFQFRHQRPEHLDFIFLLHRVVFFFFFIYQRRRRFGRY